MPTVLTRLGRWHYEEHGAGAAIVLLHGLLFDGGMWRHQIAPLAAVGRVVVLDGPGHGKSEVPPAFTLEDHAAAVVDALGALEIERAVLVGLSWGAMVALRVALAHPGRVRGLALLGASAETESRADVLLHGAFVGFGRRFGLPSAVARFHLVPMILGPRTIAEQPELVRSVVRGMNVHSRDGAALASTAVVRRGCVLGAIGRISVPTLVVCGREDRTTPVVRSERICAGISGARMVVLDDCGHISALEQPERVNEELVGFVGAVGAGSS